MENIRKSFQSGKRIALTQSITGLGGIGKTQLALQYAFDHEKTYEYVWWIDATTETAVIEGYKAFLKEIKFRMGLKASPEECVDYVRRWMSENDNYLFVFDNADSYARDGKPVLPDKMLQDYLPQNLDGNRHILITSRYKNWRKMAQEIDVRVFSLQEARDFLTSYTGLANDSFQDKLAEKLGYLPLALEQAAAYINDKGESYRGYLELFSRHNVELLKPERYPNENDPRRIVYTTWNISRDQIKRESALQLLDLLSFFAPDDIDIRWLQNGAKHLPEPLRTDIQEELECGEVLAELVRYSLITRREEHLSLHRLVQEVIRGSLETEKRNEAAECCLRICNSCIFWDFSTVESRRQFSELQPHLLSVLNASDDHLLETRAILYMFLGKGAEEHGRYDTALEEYEKVLAIRKKNLGPDHPDTATAYNNIAFVYSSKGEYGNALKGFEKALAIREKVLVPNHPSIATTYNDTAMVYSRMGEYDKALEGYEKALAIREKVLGPNDPKTAQIYNNIAVVYSRKGEYGKALGEHEKALAIKEKVLGPDHPKTAITYNNIAGVYFRTGEHEKALEEFEKALAIRDKVLGSEHPDTAISHNNIAMVHDNKGEYDRALEGYQKALVIRERVLGPDHSGTAVIYNGIASVYDNMGKYDKAMEWHEKALAIREKVLGPDHPDTATTYNNIAEVYYKKEKYGKSLGWYVCAFRVFQTKFGDRHPSTKKLYKKMCQAYEESGKTGNFKEWLDGKLAESGRCHQ
ncbi:tetratricopeptide repeat protein [Desulfosarcina sp. OttesenSCG-928-A07]|nr:tetratricopeptide repeat protein [Desulfosarcina sp. OttesenSCG-928-A07]